MLKGTPVVIVSSPMSCWNGERGRIHSFYTMSNGKPAAIVRMLNIALEVCFPLSELEREDDAIQGATH